MKKYDNHTSMCDRCGAKGYHEKPGPCLRKYPNRCKECDQCVSGMRDCGGTNVMIDYSDIARAFVSAYESGRRITVRFSTGEEKRGTVSKTTGRKPVFILMPRKNSVFSSYEISDKDMIIG